MKEMKTLEWINTWGKHERGFRAIPDSAEGWDYSANSPVRVGHFVVSVGKADAAKAALGHLRDSVG